MRTGRKVADVVIPPPDEPDCPKRAVVDEKEPVFSIPDEDAVIKALEEYAYGPAR